MQVSAGTPDLTPCFWNRNRLRREHERARHAAGRQPCRFMAASVATAKSQRLSGSQRVTLPTTVHPRTRARNAATACRGGGSSLSAASPLGMTSGLIPSGRISCFI